MNRWVARMVASPAAPWLGGKADRAGRIEVEADLSVSARPEIFAVGSTALAIAWEGKLVPGIGTPPNRAAPVSHASSRLGSPEARHPVR